MAVTQQLARLSPTLFELCRRDTVTLMRLLSFNLVGDDRHLDLDWSPHGLEQPAHARDVGQGRAVSRALEGGIKPLNAALPADAVEIAPCGLDADDVRATAAQLAAIKPSDLLAAWQVVAAEVERSTAVTDDAPAYYRRQFESLVRFYSAAARDGEAVVMWWD